MIDYTFETQRLFVKEWHSLTVDEWMSSDLGNVVADMLTPRVTEALPPAWQGAYSLERAQDWIKERDSEGVVLLVVEKASKQPIGLIILFDVANSGEYAQLRLGYLLTESAWGKGFASELVMGFVNRCRQVEVASITGGVDRGNIASRRVLEKTGFICDPSTVDAAEQIFQLQLKSNKDA